MPLMKHQSKYLSYSSKQRKSQLFMEILNAPRFLLLSLHLSHFCHCICHTFVIASVTLSFFTNMNLNYFTGDTNSFTSGKRSEKIHFRICRYLKRQFILGMGKNHW